MATRYHNVTGSTGVTVELLKPGDSVSGIKSILITNTHASAVATVTLFVQTTVSSTLENYKILNTVSIPAKVSLLLDESSIFNFPNHSKGFGFYITVGSSDTIDVLINI
tara:strand:- start:525 stop:851 length:327 start_codon:yes stop_codon:yes gene_type:complete